MSATNYAENQQIDTLFRTSGYWYIALFNAITSAEAGTVTECTGGGYARVAVARSLTNWAGTQGDGTTAASSGASGTTSNNAPVTFGAPVGDWGELVGFGFSDAATGGNLWFIDQLRDAAGNAITRTVLSGEAAPYFAAGALRVSLD